MKLRSYISPKLAWIFLILSSSLFGQMRIIPHLTSSSGGFTTRIIMANESDAAQDYQLTPYQADGTSLTEVNGTIGSGETRVFEIGDLFGQDEVSHFTINDVPISFTITYQVADGSNSAAHIGENTEQAMRWRIYPGSLNDVLDGLAVVNVGSNSSEIFARQVSFSGQELGRVMIDTADPNSKTLYLFDDFTKSSDSFYEIFANTPLTLTALRFANNIPNARFFWETEAVTLPPLIETPMDPRIGQTATFPANSVYGITGGQAVIVDERTIRIDNLTYNGQGPDVRVFLGLNGNYINGFPISGIISGSGPLNNASLTFTLPEGRTLDDFNGISIWCTIFLLDFSSGLFQ